MSKRLERSSTDKVLTGVCGGVAAYLGVDAGLVRILTIAISAFTGVGLVVYVAAALVLPEEGTNKSILSDLFNSAAGKAGASNGDPTKPNGPVYGPNSDDLR